MSKKDKKKFPIDFDVGISSIIPSTQEAFQTGSFSGSVRKEEKVNVTSFKNNFLQKVEETLIGKIQFPTDNEIFVFIVQYFISEKEYKSRDIDNMAKTILDALKGPVCKDDGQVKTLLVSKKIENGVTSNFAYIAIKELTDRRDVEALRVSGLDKSINLYRELKNKGLI